MLTADVLGERARLTPDKLALVCVATGARRSFREWDTRASQAARLLRERLGLARGARVGLLCGNRLEFLEVFFAGPKSGLVPVPLSTRLTPREHVAIARHAGFSALVYAADQAASAQAVCEALPGLPAVALDAALCAEHVAYAEARALDCWPTERGAPEDLATLLYTSGTTGRPKGVRIPQRMLAWNGYNTVASWQLRADDVSPIFTPLAHAGGLCVFLVPLIVVGGTSVLHAGFDAGEVWRTLERERCSVVLGVPTLFKLLLEAPEFAQVDLSSVRFLISGGAPLPPFIQAAYERRGVVFKQGYGLTEAGVNCFAISAADARRKPGSIGQPLMLTEALLLDEQGRELAAGEVGELCLRGPHVCSGYWDDEAASAAVFDERGFFHTGDLARRDDEGFYWIAGRRKDMFISGGLNVYPAEVEAELLQHPGLRDAALVGVAHETWGEVGVAFVVPAGAPPAPEELREFLRPRLAKYKLPSRYVFVDELPRTPTGKLRKDELRAGWSAAGEVS